METQTLAKGKNTVYFDSDGFKLEGHLWIPEDYVEGEKRPAIIVTRPAGGVKEQTAGLYAEKFSQKGFIALAYDVKGFGGSQGKIPQNEDPYSIIDDAKHAADYIASLPQVDSKNLIQSGPCMGAAYGTCAAIGDDRVSAVVQIAPYLTFYEDYPKALGGIHVMKYIMTPILALLKLIHDVFHVNIYLFTVPDKRWQQAIPHPPIVFSMRDYYLAGKPGDVPTWTNKINLYQAANVMWKYSVFEYLPHYKDIPFFMAYGTKEFEPERLQKFYDGIHAAEKEVMTLNAQHFEMYWKPEFVNAIVDRATDFIRRHLR